MICGIEDVFTGNMNGVTGKRNYEMSLLGWIVGAALLDEWDRREEEEDARKEAQRKADDLRRRNDANEQRIRRLEDELRRLKGGRGGERC